MTVNEFAQDVHKNAVAHGWYDAPITFPEVAVMIHAEISEAVGAETRLSTAHVRCRRRIASFQKSAITSGILRALIRRGTASRRALRSNSAMRSCASWISLRSWA